MTLRAALRAAIEQLAAAQVPSASTAAEVLLLHVLGHDRAFLYAHPESELTIEQERAYRHLVGERAAGKPTQYLTGEQEFWGMSFRVTPGVFIPRPETEHVVEVALTIVRERMGPDRERMGTEGGGAALDREGTALEPERMAARPVRIVDVGTGTGCIALALARELPEAEIIGVDIDPVAVALARENAVRLKLDYRVRFEQSDLLGIFLEAKRQGGKEGEEAKEAKEGNELREHRSLVAGRWPAPSAVEGSPIDLIVSNPPYVAAEEAAQLPREVRQYEPPTALYSPDEGLAITRRLIEQAVLLLAPHGWLVLELGYKMSERVRSLLGEGWTHIEITDDLRGIPRVLAAQRC